MRELCAFYDSTQRLKYHTATNTPPVVGCLLSVGVQILANFIRWNWQMDDFNVICAAPVSLEFLMHQFINGVFSLMSDVVIKLVVL